MAEQSKTVREKWYHADPDEPEAVVAAIVARAQAIETWTMGVRYQNALYARLATGRDLPVLFGASLARRVGPSSTVYARSRFDLPTHNIIAMGIETIYNRFGTSRPWITVIPNGDSNARQQAKAQEAWFAKTFERKKIYEDVYRLCFNDGETWGDGLCLVEAWKKDLRYTRILRDECLIDEIEAARGKPRSLIISRLVPRDELAEDYQDDSDTLEAIERAPAAVMGTYGGELGDVIQAFIAIKLANDEGEFGRKTVCLAQHMISDEKYKRSHFPIARLRGIPQSLGFWSMGIPEAGWDYQLEVNRTMAVIHEGQKHGAIGTVLAEEDSMVSTKQLASSLQQRIVRYRGVQPQFIAPQAVSQEVYSYRREIVQDYLMRIGISPSMAGGEKEPGITSGRALITMEQIHDNRNVSWGRNGEDFLTDLADLTYEAAEELKLSVDTPEGRIDWSDVEMAPGGARRQAFPISSLPSEPAGREQRIASWLANGMISRAEAFRLEDVPDTERFVSMATAIQDELEWTLDKVVKEERFYPPEVYDDLPTALATTNARYHYEKRRGASPAVLKLLRDFMQAIGDLVPPPAPPAPPGQPGLGTPVAPSPVQVAPDMPAPAGPAPMAVS